MDILIYTYKHESIYLYHFHIKKLSAYIYVYTFLAYGQFVLFITQDQDGSNDVALWKLNELGMLKYK